MNFYKILTGLLITILLLGVVTMVEADDPPETPAYQPPPQQGNFEPIPIQPGKAVFDPSTASVTRLELAEDNQTLVPAAAPTPTLPSPSGKGVFEPGPVRLSYIDENGLHTIPNSTRSANDLLMGQPQNIHSAGDVDAAASTILTFLDFEGGFTPPGPPDWDALSTGTYFWDDVNCFPVDGGVSSAWPADLAGLNPCGGTPDNYPASLASWLVYGPFSLADAQAASLDFFFRLVSQSCVPITSCDYLFWGASLDGNEFFGNFAAGTYTGGPWQNGYNFASLDLSNVPELGDVTGQSEVWIGFLFNSNNDATTAQGPFLDLISLRKNTDARVYLTNENFDIATFPNLTWESFDYSGNNTFWDDVECFARSPSWSLWPAATDWPVSGLDPCSGDSYVNNMESWMVHGPFDLSNASEAWIDFYFRIESETNKDFLFYGVSTNNNNFHGFSYSGTYISGPHNNGHNLERLDLSNTPTLGDLRGSPQVWLAFVFSSDVLTTTRGPFIDDVQVIVEKTVGEEVYIPVLIKSPPPVTPKTNLYINNQTGAVIANYTVFNPKLNGAPIPNIVCANIPVGATNFNCNATFDTKTYQVSSTNGCSPPVTTGQVTFKVGNDIRLVRCR